MTMINSIGKALSNDGLHSVATGAKATVLIMTGVKAVGRPAFIYADKKTDAETKKYSATKEFLYQILCLGLTFAMLPAFEKGGLKLAQKYVPEGSKVAEMLTKAKSSKEGFAKSFKAQASVVLDEFKNTKNPELKSTVDMIHKVSGGKELGSLVGSVVGLTLVAPILSHEILHPIMKAIGMDKKAQPKQEDIAASSAKVDAHV